MGCSQLDFPLRQSFVAAETLKYSLCYTITDRIQTQICSQYSNTKEIYDFTFCDILVAFFLSVLYPCLFSSSVQHWLLIQFSTSIMKETQTIKNAYKTYTLIYQLNLSSTFLLHSFLYKISWCYCPINILPPQLYIVIKPNFFVVVLYRLSLICSFCWGCRYVSPDVHLPPKTPDQYFL